MDNCQTCGSEKLCKISAKCSDQFYYRNLWSGHEYDGYVPLALGIGDSYGDYVEFAFCRDCGQIQGDWPKPVEKHHNIP